MKTIDQKSKIYANEMVNQCSGITLEMLKEYCINDFKAGVEFAQKWIPISEELPEKKNHNFSDLVLTRDKIGSIQLERYDYEFKCFNGKRYDIKEEGDGQVTEWRYIALL